MNRTKKMPKNSIVSLVINYPQHVWAIDFNGLLLDFSALCKRRLLALHKPFNIVFLPHSFGRRPSDIYIVLSYSLCFERQPRLEAKNSTLIFEAKRTKIFKLLKFGLKA